jgi:exopolyphosphatase/guanosine-5'-triphosphate,3'-diphosphate pyrophosphatase
MPETLVSKEPIGVIDIGSSAIRLVIAEVGPRMAIRYLENLQKPAPLGKEVFTNGRLSHGVIRDSIEILKNFKELADTYGVKRLQTIATSAIREAANRDNFVDQVFVRTGIDVEVVEGPEENRLELIAVEHAVEGRFDFDKKNCLIIEVGSGSTEIIITTKGAVSITRSLPIGTIRLPEQAEPGKTEPAALQRIIKRYVRAIAEDFLREYDLKNIDSFIALGFNMRFLSKQVAGEPEAPLAIMKENKFSEIVKNFSKMSIEDVVDVYGIPYLDAESLYPSLLLYAGFMAETQANEIIVPMVSIRDGLLIETAQLLSGYKRTDLSRQVTSSAKSLGRKYRYDEAHALNVAQLSLKLFDLLKEDHGLGPRERMLLEVSGILHDIGMFISPTSHHKHSSYLVDAAEIFGLRKSDKDVVSNVVRYHRRSPPQPKHVTYMSLPRADRAVVSKLAAILRVADALDKSHQQKIRDFTLERYGDVCNLWVPEEVGDISLEKDALSRKDSMFTDVLGANVVLKQGIPVKAEG